MPSHELTSQINWPPDGKYVIAVSGGVDSVCLLNLLAQSSRKYELIVAHFDHGMREDSKSDAEFVRELADRYGLEFWTERAELAGKGEAEARTTRYEFLEQVMVKSGAAAIITAHHADDRLETSLINALRGTGAAGLVALTSEPKRQRPLLGIAKSELINYAHEHNLKWREDSTNESTDYTRNLIRHEVIVKGDWPEYREQQATLSDTLEQYRSELAAWSNSRGVEQTKSQLAIPMAALNELTLTELGLALTEWLRTSFGQNPLEQAKVERLGLFLKHAHAGSIMPLDKQKTAIIEYDRVVITSSLRHNIDTPQANWLSPGDSMIFGQYRLRFGEHNTSQLQIGLKSDKIQVRSMVAGDRILTSAGTKKLQDVFINAKIDRSSRRIWPIICDSDGTILSVLGLAFAPEPDKPRHYLSYEEV